MAKFTKTYENGIIENKLIFRGKKFTITMEPNEGGSISKERGKRNAVSCDTDY